MIRSVVILGLLAAAGWYAYRKVMGGGTRPVTADGAAGTGDQSNDVSAITGRVTQSVSQAAVAVRQAATTAVSKARAAVPLGGGDVADRGQPETERDGAPPEARAAAMAAMPAVQPPASLPEP